MGELSTPPTAHNASSKVLPQSTLASGIPGEDEDEPPSSGLAPNFSQVNSDTQGLTHDSKSVVVDNDVNNDTSNLPFFQRVGERKTDSQSSVAVAGERASSGIASSLSEEASQNEQEKSAIQVVFPRSARLRALFRPQRPLGPRPSYMASIRATLLYTPLNVLLIFIPVSWAMHHTHQNPTLVFSFSALAIIPLAALLGLGTEQIALKTSQSVGGLLNATLGNIVELIIAGIALQQCELELVQSSLLGGLLSNLLLVLGMAFIVGGFRFQHQEFQPMVAQLNSSLLIVSVLGFLLPVAFHEYLEGRLNPGTELGILLQLSRGSAIILMLMYLGYLVFQFYSHNHLFLDTMQPCSSRPGVCRPTFARTSTEILPLSNTSCRGLSISSLPSNIERPKLNIPTAMSLLVVATTLAYVTAENLVNSLHGMIAQNPSISKEWITLIVIPVISNAAEHTTAVVVARKGKFDLAMSVAVGSCIQIALFVIPLLVIIAWGMNKPLMLLFDPLETLALFFSVLLVKFCVEDGKSHWMSGLVLISAYILVALAFWDFPQTPRLLQGQPIVCP